jgi:hypothetical protein
MNQKLKIQSKSVLISISKDKYIIQYRQKSFPN